MCVCVCVCVYVCVCVCVCVCEQGGTEKTEVIGQSIILHNTVHYCVFHCPLTSYSLYIYIYIYIYIYWSNGCIGDKLTVTKHQ